VASQAEIDLIVDASDTLPQLTRDLDRIVRTAEDGADTIDIDAALDSQASLTALAADLDRVVASATTNASDIDIDAVLDTARTVARLNEDLSDVIARAQSGADQDPVRIDGVLNGPSALASVSDDLAHVIDDAERMADDIDIDVDIDTHDATRSLRMFLPELDGVTRTATRAAGALVPVATGIAGAGAAAGTAVPLLAGVVAALESIVPAAAVGTQAMLAMKLASVTLKVGMMGVTDAVTAAFDPEARPEDLAKAMENLAPEARKFVKELASMRDAWDSLRLDVQDRLFRDLDDSVSTLARSALPQVEDAMGRTADTLNDMAQGAVAAAAELAANGTLGRALDGATTGLENLVDLPGQATTAFGQLSAAAAPAFDRITDAVARVADAVSRDLTRAFESGELEDSINDAVDVVKQLGSIAGNVFGTLRNLISGVSTDGEGLFGTLEKITQTLEDVTGTEQFQSALSELSETMSTLATNAAPLLTTALSIISEVVEILAPVARELIDTLGPQLEEILEASREPLKAMAGAFEELVIALSPVIDLAGELIVALLPVLTPLFETLGEIIKDLAPVIKELAENLGAQLVPILEKLPEILDIILPAFEKMADEIFPVLAEMLKELEPSLRELSTALGDLAVELAPLIGKFFELSAVIVGELLDLLGPILLGLLEGLIESLKFFAEMIDGTVIPVIRGLKKVLQGDGAGALAEFGKATDNAKVTVGKAFANMLAEVGGIMSSFVATMTRRAAESGQRLADGVKAGIDRMIGFLAGMPSRIVGSIGNIGGLLTAAGRALMQGFINGITSQIGRIQDLLQGVTAMIPDWKGPAERDAELLTENGRLIMQSLLDGFEDRIPDVKATLGGLTSEIPRSVGVGNTRSMVSPVVYVSIGNEAVDQYVTTRIDQRRDDDSRRTAQGVRR